MAELLFSAETFRPDGSSVLGVPMLLDAKMRLIEPACAWLMHVALVRGRTRSPETWRTYGEALYDWWQTIEANDWRWDSVGSGEIAAYRDNMLHPPDDDEKPLARSTISWTLPERSTWMARCSWHPWRPTAIPPRAVRLMILQSSPLVTVAALLARSNTTARHWLRTSKPMAAVRFGTM